MSLSARLATWVAPPDMDPRRPFSRWRAWIVMFLRAPTYEGARLTLRRRLNVYLMRLEIGLLRTKLWSRPVKLIVEPTNVCNLSCPACFTGDGQVGRARRPMPLALYHKLLDELGDYLLQIDFANWGEPLLAKHLPEMIEAASRRGISTVISTNFSIPFDATKAERLVASGLAILGVSLDGVEQETYAQYRVGGNLERVLHNCRLVMEAKQRLGSATPKMVWGFHVFSHNVQDVERAKDMARALGMEIAIEKGWVVGEEWDREGTWHYAMGEVQPFPCLFLWHTAVVNNDGGVAPCCGTFYREDDMGQLSLGDGDGGAATFAEVWNGPRFQQARRLFRARSGSAETRKTICYECPTTIVWERWREHRAARRDPRSFTPGYTANDNFNYFWNRRPPGAGPGRPAARAQPRAAEPGAVTSPGGQIARPPSTTGRVPR
jgi:organic radical activating enzyme